MEGNKNVAYSGVVLDSKSKSKLLRASAGELPAEWDVIAHHLTIKLGPMPELLVPKIGSKIRMSAIEFGRTDMAMAVKVEVHDDLVQKSMPADRTPHITLAVNRRDGGKPVMSNRISDWVEIEPIELEGILSEVPRH